MKKEFILQYFLFSGLRRLSYRYPARSECLKKYRVSRGKYKCAKCQRIFRKKDIAIDHIEAVVNPLTGFIDWNTYIARLFCPLDGLQVLCNNGKDSCHKVKSKQENTLRRLNTKAKK